MFDDYFVTRNIRSVHSDIQNVVPSSITIHLETVLTADKGLLETFAANLDLKKNKVQVYLVNMYLILILERYTYYIR